MMHSRLRIVVVLCLSVAFVHFLVFEIPSIYDNYVVGVSSLIGESDALDAVLTESASLTSDSPSSTTNMMAFPENSSLFLSGIYFNNTSEFSNKTYCPRAPPGLVGPIRVFLDEPSFGNMAKMFKRVAPGGHAKPADCISRHKVAIIVPYRDREAHLRIFLHNMHSLLEKQQIEYAIYVVDQVANQTFNRGKLMNVGYAVASQMYPWQCYIFHDVDLLPEDDRNLYTCPVQPRHMSVAVDKFNYKLPYSAIFGGISALSKDQVKAINGFSNNYWGWGGEDDDLAERTTDAGFKVSRYPVQIARYKMIKHKQESTNPVNKCRYKLMAKTKVRWRHDGLTSLKYQILDVQLLPLYTRVYADLLEKESKKELRRLFPFC